ncbi:MAG: hypothetical protein OXH84_00285 [Gammaproteobacteria bacterium]|nr:hypothetical protein [Gammaproteobacteria bacterium]
MIAPKPRRTRKQFSVEFKHGIVALIQNSNLTDAQTFDRMGMSQLLLYRWKRELTAVSIGDENPLYEQLLSGLGKVDFNYLTFREILFGAMKIFNSLIA